MTSKFLLPLVLMALMTQTVQGAGELFNAQGLRVERYRAPLPSTVPGGATVSVGQLKKLMQQKPLHLVDVQAIAVRSETADFAIDWLPSSVRYHLPGSIWLPNVGYGELDALMQQFFQRELHLLTKGELSAAIVFYCVADCWMSWNAVQRAAKMGYSELYWFPQGTDGWEQQGYELVEATPQPLFEE